ncbi:unnamed protein product [Ilex paraguariensis]|uniref:Alpha-carbonic anhydrase domain-containing protein n=1 Tax=Ilex paraguariensis TaxID=185542 RepID=A0ABC8R2T7_9AQUA
MYRFALEVHLVHESEDEKTAVFGIMYKIGRSDSFLSMLKDKLEAIADTRGEVTVVGTVDPKLIKMGSRKYYRYIGSLTVPPCTQNVVWTILRKVRTVTREQVALIREAVHDMKEGEMQDAIEIGEDVGNDGAISVEAGAQEGVDELASVDEAMAQAGVSNVPWDGKHTAIGAIRGGASAPGTALLGTDGRTR